MWEFIRKVGIGFVSGTIASIANIPIDVAKSRIQVNQEFTFFGLFIEILTFLKLLNVFLKLFIKYTNIYNSILKGIFSQIVFNTLFLYI